MESIKPRYVNTFKAAEYLGMSPSYMNKMRLTGDGPPFAKIGTRVAYDLDDLAAWVEARKQTSTSDK
ncbi:helix-turn-helix transcriptional regulator [Maricaulis sp.]|uniref:helix-turn-helix transcriptional regulator n=1 Tax=Maricaulis sp. TaxID=1486257 RepID=UPI003A9119D7